MQTRTTIPLPGSERKPAIGARIKGPINGDDLVEVRITLNAPSSLIDKANELASQPLNDRQYVSRSEFEKRYGSDDATIQQIEQFAADHNLSVRNVDKVQHAIYLTGNARDVSLAFQTYLEAYEQADGTTYRGRTGSLQIPQNLAGKILSIDGLDERPVAQPKLRMRPLETGMKAAQSIEYTPQQVASLYSFPTGVTGKGQCIGIIELGGGYKQTDLNTYFGATQHTVTAVSVDRGRNHPTGNADGPDAEVMLDIEVAGSVASGASIAVYFAPNTNKGFLDAISAAVHDTTRKPSAISISWGSPEDGGGYSQSALNSFNQIFQSASVLGVTILVAAGDNGSSDGVSTGNHVDFPASSPWVTACGGTTLTAPDKVTIQNETVWNDGADGGATGGGISTVFPVPTYQQGLHATLSNNTTTALTGRGVPDIAADADPNTGYNVLVDGQSFPVGGTSAVAPLLAGLVALLNQELGKPMGFWNPLLYKALGTTAFRDVTSGNNGTYAASRGWDACSGVGVAVGNNLAQALKGQAAKAVTHKPSGNKS
jgi:kumamolisin